MELSADTTIAPTVTSGATVAGAGGIPDSTIDEDLREASALGDLDRVAGLLAAGASITSANRMNGWTALHWAAKRGHTQVVSLLLSRNADPLARNTYGQTPADLTSCEKTAILLGGGNGNRAGVASAAVRRSAPVAAAPALVAGDSAAAAAPVAEFVPNYLRNPEFPYAKPPARRRRASGGGEQHQPDQSLRRQQQHQGPLVLLARVAGARDPDFIEVELPSPCPSYAGLLDLLCQELCQEPESVERIRKLPNVRLRNDGDVARLECGQQLEVVLRHF